MLHNDWSRLLLIWGEDTVAEVGLNMISPHGMMFGITSDLSVLISGELGCVGPSILGHISSSEAQEEKIQIIFLLKL